MRKIISITALAAVAVMAFSVPASAGPLPPPAPQLPSTGGGNSSSKARTTLILDAVFLTNGASFWSGDIASPKAKCANKRAVTVYKVRPGADKKIGSDKAFKRLDGSGYSWGVEKVGYSVKSSERFYAKVSATDTCKGARSAVRSRS